LEDQYKVTRIQKQQERKNNNETGNN
jgi:hypothetical protein